MYLSTASDATLVRKWDWFITKSETSYQNASMHCNNKKVLVNVRYKLQLI